MTRFNNAGQSIISLPNISPLCIHLQFQLLHYQFGTFSCDLVRNLKESIDSVLGDLGYLGMNLVP